MKGLTAINMLPVYVCEEAEKTTQTKVNTIAKKIMKLRSPLN